MGIRFLQSFMTQNVPSGMLDVDMKREVEKFKLNNNGKKPTIVVDLLSINPNVYGNNHEILLGGRFNIYVERINSVLDKLKSIGANLVFFVDGPTQGTKMITSLGRKNRKYDDSIEVLSGIYCGLDLRYGFESMEVSQAPHFFSTLTKTVANFGEVRISNLNECDLELANYANENGALAIISNDTDFIIFEGDWRFWSSNIDFETLETKEFNKQALYRTLGLTAKQMPIFASLAGNDIMQFDTLKNFHRTIRTRGTHFYGIADKIKSLGYDCRTINSRHILALSKLICSSSAQCDAIQASIDSYDYSKCTKEYENELIKEAAKEKFNYIILANIPYVVSLYHFDLSENDFMPFYKLLAPLIKRTMGILLYDKRNNPDINRTFYTKTSHYQPYVKITERPEYPKYNVPEIFELIAEPVGFNPELDDKRYKLACWALSEKLNRDMIEELPDENVLDVLALFYLRQLDQITLQEADCILLACNKTDKDLVLDDVTRINGRDARIAFLFPVIRTYVRRLITAVGLKTKEICTLPTFDGLYFHYLRKSWDTEDNEYRNSILKNYLNLRIYENAKAAA